MTSSIRLKLMIIAGGIGLIGLVTGVLQEPPYQRVLSLPTTNDVTCQVTVVPPWEDRHESDLRVGQGLAVIQSFQSQLPNEVVVALGPLWISNVVELQIQAGEMWVDIPHSATAFDGVKVFRKRGGSQARKSIDPKGKTEYRLGFSGSFVIDKPGKYRVRTLTEVFLGPEISDTRKVVSPYHEFELHPAKP
ncbi:hypothetical protein [Planctopirus hydrillae]|uniref:Uncharacterized protein n=1 Tax=Planctopirus hydrillae TaxID=1841610 RepID=A0A1C3EHH8_9PLAN|nr:hypothetical protein [Planctopirus hydrillae]ODA32687.1 hypothetical protein A6X21_20285 [Planctopirus hydrillae]